MLGSLLTGSISTVFLLLPTHPPKLSLSLTVPTIYLQMIPLRQRRIVPPPQSQTICHIEENINVVVHAGKQLLARSLGENRHIRQTMHPLGIAYGQCPIDDKASDCIFIIDDVVVSLDGGVHRGHTRTRFVDFVVFSVVWVGADGREEGIAWVPIRREGLSFRVDEGARIAGVAGVDVLRKAGLLVRTDSAALFAVCRLGFKVVGVDATGNVEAMAVIGCDENECFVHDAEGGKLGEGGVDGVIKFKNVAKGTIVIQSMHLLVDGGGFGHEEKAFFVVALVQDVESFKGHFLEAGLICRRRVGAVRLVGFGNVQIGFVDIAVKPDSHVRDGEDPKSFLVVANSAQGGVVLNNVVPCICKEVVVVLPLVRALAG